MRIYKPQATKPIPDGAKIDRDKGIVTYKVRGRTRRAVLTIAGSGERMRVETSTWHIEFRDCLGRKQHVTGYRHESQSRLLASQIDRLVSLHGQPLPLDLVRPIGGLPSRIKEQLAEIGLLEGRRTVVGRTLDELITEFEQSLRAQELCEQYITDSIQLARILFEDCGFEHFGDITANKVEAYLKDLRNGAFVREGSKKKPKRLSYRRSNGYLKAAKLFCGWLIKRGYAYESPLTPLKALDTELDRRHVRRALDVGQLRQLLRVTVNGPESHGMSGLERFLLYRFIVETGLRAKEIRRLRKSDFDYDQHVVNVKATTAKGKRGDTQYLSPGLCAELAQFMRAKLGDTKAFGGSYVALTDKTCDMLQEDLVRAEIPYKDDAGRVFDFHSLRGQCATLLAASGASMKTAQTILRHKDVNLTANVYTHVLHGQEAQAVANLPDLSLASLEAVKTGTDDRDVTPESLREVYSQDEQHRTKPDCIGQVNADSGSKTALVSQNQGYERPTELRVGGPSPSRRSMQVVENQALTKSNPISEIGKPGKFSESLRGGGGIDRDLQTVIDRWPGLSPELRAAILRMIG